MSWENSTSRLCSDIYLRIINEPEYWMTLAVIDFALSAVTVVANSILLVTIWYDPLRSLRTPPCLLMGSLSSADLLVGLCVIPMVALRDVYRSLQQVVPLPSIVGTIASCILGATLFVSSATIVAMSTACFYAINNPFRYKTNITRKRVYWLIIMIWIVSVLICLLPVINIPEKTYMLIYTHTHISLPALLLVIIFVKGFRSLSRRRRELLRSTNTSARNHKLALERKRNMAVVVTTILMMFYITYLPQFIIFHLENFCSPCQISEDSIAFHKISVITSRFIFVNSAANPFVYAWRMPKYRRALASCWKAIRDKLKRFGSLLAT